MIIRSISIDLSDLPPEGRAAAVRRGWRELVRTAWRAVDQEGGLWRHPDDAGMLNKPSSEDGYEVYSGRASFSTSMLRGFELVGRSSPPYQTFTVDLYWRPPICIWLRKCAQLDAWAAIAAAGLIMVANAADLYNAGDFDRLATEATSWWDYIPRANRLRRVLDPTILGLIQRRMFFGLIIIPILAGGAAYLLLAFVEGLAGMIERRSDESTLQSVVASSLEGADTGWRNPPKTPSRQLLTEE